MKNISLALFAAFVLSGCPDTKVPKVPPKVPEPKATQTVQTLQVNKTTGQSWIVERAPPRPVWPM